MSPSSLAQPQTTMRNLKKSVLLSFLGVLLVCPYVHTTSVPSSHQALTNPTTACQSGLCSTTGQEEHPRVERLMMQKCDSGLESYCLHNGECMLLLDLNEHHCKCERGYYGPRCAHLELVFQPMREEHVILMVVCVGLLIIGIAGALYFFCKWYKRNRCPPQQKQQRYQGVQMA